MAVSSPPDSQTERRGFTRYRVDLQAVAHRGERNLPSLVRSCVPVTIVDISQVGLRWHSRDVFYKGEFVALGLPTGEDKVGLQCVVRVCRTRRISGQYEVVGLFAHVRHKDAEEPAATVATTSSGASE